MKLLIKDKMVYTIQNGELKKLGIAAELKQICDDVFYVENGPTYVIQNNKVSVLSEGAFPTRIMGNNTIHPENDMPEQIKELKDALKKNLRPSTDLSSKIHDAYFEQASKYSPCEFSKLRQEAVVMKRANSSKLFVKNEKGRYLRAKGVAKLDFEDYSGFVYHGAIYVQNLIGLYEKLPFTPIFAAKQYMLFYSGGNNLFALKQSGKIVKLGALQQFFVTPRGVVIEVETEYSNKYALYYLGRNLSLIFERMYDEDFDFDLQTSGLTHYRTDFSDGYKIGRTDYYVLKKGRYTKLELS